MVMLHVQTLAFRQGSVEPHCFVRGLTRIARASSSTEFRAAGCVHFSSKPTDTGCSSAYVHRSPCKGVQGRQPTWYATECT